MDSDQTPPSAASDLGPYCLKGGVSHFFQEKILAYVLYLMINGFFFKDTLTKDIVSFEQPGPDQFD